VAVGGHPHYRGCLPAWQRRYQLRQYHRALFLQRIDPVGGRDHALSHGGVRVHRLLQRGLGRKQIRMDVVVGMLPAKIRTLLALFSELVLIATAAAVTAFAYPVIVQLAQFDERSQAANFPLVIPQAMVPIGYTLMAVLVAVRLMSSRRSQGADAGPDTSRH
jgi:hypothetical protein